MCNPSGLLSRDRKKDPDDLCSLISSTADMFTSLDITDSVTDLTSSTENETDSSVRAIEQSKISDDKIVSPEGTNIKLKSEQRHKIVTYV